MPRIFISYSRVDRPVVNRLVPMLRKVYEPNNVWFDESLYGGQVWWDEILAQIAACDIFIYLLSNESLESEYCLAEYKEAIRLQKQILPVQVRARTKIPDDLKRIQFVDMSAGIMQGINDLHAAITKSAAKIPINTPPQPINSVPVPIPNVFKPKKGRIRLNEPWAIIIAAVFTGIFVLVAALIGNGSFQYRIIPTPTLDDRSEAITLVAQNQLAALQANKTLTLAAFMTSFVTETNSVMDAFTATADAYTDTPTVTFTPSNTATDDYTATANVQATLGAQATANFPTNTPRPELPHSPVPPNTSTPGVQVIVNPATANPGGMVAVNLNLFNVDDLYGIQAKCTVNPAVLEGMNFTDGEGFNKNNSFFVDEGYKPDGSWNMTVSRLHPNPAISGNPIAFTLNYNVLSADSSPVICELLGADINGNKLPLEVVNSGYNGAQPPTPQPTLPLPTPTLRPTATPIPPTVIPGQPSIIFGTVMYPGMTDYSNITISLYASAGDAPLVQLVTNANGYYQFVDVPVGSYILRISAPQSLVLQRDVEVDSDGLSIDLGTDVLPMGDTDNNGAIDISDIALVAVNFGFDGSLVKDFDLNRDTVINVLDLVIVSTNFGLTSPVVRGN